MKEVSVVIPNYNGIGYIRPCLDSLMTQTVSDFEILVVDNGSGDGSRETWSGNIPASEVIALEDNTRILSRGECGIQATDTPYIILLNNDTTVLKDFVEKMLDGIRKRPRAFSCGAKMLQMHSPEKMDDAGITTARWAGPSPGERGKSRSDTVLPVRFSQPAPARPFTEGSCWRRPGCLTRTFCLSGRIWIWGYRAKILGYENWFLPEAVVYHAGSGTSGSRYNLFKVRYSSRNNIYMIYKNMPWLQILINLPFLTAGFLIKLIFFAAKGFGREYARRDKKRSFSGF